MASKSQNKSGKFSSWRQILLDFKNYYKAMLFKLHGVGTVIDIKTMVQNREPM
jgi:hypothetical protein